MNVATQAVSYLREVRTEPAERGGGSPEVRRSKAERGWAPSQGLVRPMTRPRLIDPLPATEAATWEHYLARLETIAGIGERHAGAARELWARLVESVGSSLRVPAAGPGGELGFYFSWNYDRAYVSVDLAPDGRLEWFSTLGKHGPYEGSADDEVLFEPPEALLAALVRHCLRP